MFTICQHFFSLGGEVRRSIERMMSRCFTWFPISGLGEPNIYHDSEVYYKKWKDCGGLSDCEELVGEINS